MHKSAFTRWFLVWFLAAILLLCVTLGIRVAAADPTSSACGASEIRAAALSWI
jgi:hypothetical protein